MYKGYNNKALKRYRVLCWYYVSWQVQHVHTGEWSEIRLCIIVCATNGRGHPVSFILIVAFLK